MRVLQRICISRRTGQGEGKAVISCEILFLVDSNTTAGDGMALCQIVCNRDCVYKVNSQTQQSTTIWSLGAPHN